MKKFKCLLLILFLSGCGGSSNGDSPTTSEASDSSQSAKKLLSIEITSEIESIKVDDVFTLSATAIWDDNSKTSISETGKWTITPADSGTIRSNILTAKLATEAAVLTVNYQDKSDSISFKISQEKELMSKFPKFDDDSMYNAFGLNKLDIRLRPSFSNYEYTGLLWGDRYYLINSNESKNLPLELNFAKASTYSRGLSCLMDLNFMNSKGEKSLVTKGSAIWSNSSCFRKNTHRMIFNFKSNNETFFGHEVMRFYLRSEGSSSYYNKYPNGGYTIDNINFKEVGSNNIYTIHPKQQGYSLKGVDGDTGCTIEAELSELHNFVFYLQGATSACIDDADQGNIDGVLHYDSTTASIGYSLVDSHGKTSKHYTAQITAK